MKSKQYDKKMFRLIAILNQLNTSGFVKTVDLAKEFNTNIGTIQRDIALLNEVGFPMIGEYGKYTFMEGFSLRKIKVTPEEKYLLTLLCRIFSGDDTPLHKSSQNLLNKVLVESKGKNDSDVDLPNRKRVILERQIEDLSKTVQVGCQDDPCSESFEREVEMLDVHLKNECKAIKIKDGFDLKVVPELNHKEPRLFCSVLVPRKYIQLPSTALVSGGDRPEPFQIDFQRMPPDAIYDMFYIEANINLITNLFGPFIEPKKFTCFDVLMGRFGFPVKNKLVDYEYSYAN